MSNLDNIIDEILQDAENESKKVVEDAKSEVAVLVGKTESEAQKKADKIIEKAKVEATQSKERIISNSSLTARDMVVLDLDANVIENESGLRPTSESLMHLQIYKTRPDVNAVCHTHSMYATTFAVLNKPIPAVVYEIANLGVTKSRIPVAPYGRPGTTDLSDSVIEPVQEADVFLLQGHGAVAVSQGNIYDAYLRAAYIEELAQLYYNALCAGQGEEPYFFPPEELQKWEYPSQIKFPNK